MQFLHLKSSLDRFIVKALSGEMSVLVHLKSSLDRFIEVYQHQRDYASINLKSSLDRFIGLCIDRLLMQFCI